jgi:6-phosphogluconolactonase
MIDKVEWHTFSDAEVVAQMAVHQILLKAQESISHRGIFKLVLSGGTTPKRIYELLAQQHQEWSKWQFFIGDERCLDVDDPERNSFMIRHTLLDPISDSHNFPIDNFFPINAEQGAERGANDYAQIIQPFLPLISPY